MTFFTRLATRLCLFFLLIIQDLIFLVLIPLTIHYRAYIIISQIISTFAISMLKEFLTIYLILSLFVLIFTLFLFLNPGLNQILRLLLLVSLVLYNFAMTSLVRAAAALPFISVMTFLSKCFLLLHLYNLIL